MAGNLEVSTFQPHMVQVQYDIGNPVVRMRVMHKLYRALFRRTNYSVYEGPFTAALLNELREIQASEPAVDIKVRTPSYPRDQLLAAMQEYDNAFALDFEELNKTIRSIEKAIAIPTLNGLSRKEIDEAIKDGALFFDRKAPKGKKWTPYTEKQLEQKIKLAYYTMRQLERDLAKRKAREIDRDFTALEDDLRPKAAYIDTLKKSLAARGRKAAPPASAAAADTKGGKAQ